MKTAPRQKEITLTESQFEDLRSWINSGLGLSYWLDDDNNMGSDPLQKDTFALAHRVNEILSGTAEITLAMSRQDGAQAAAQMFAAGELLPEHATNNGADNWGEPGCNLGDAAYEAFSGSRHAGASDVIDDDHWNAFLEAFEEVGRMCLVEKKPFDF